MPEELTPVIREEEYLAAIAGQDVTPPDPATRKEEWLDLIADNVAGLAGDLSTAEGEIDDLQDLVPTPEAADSGKVLTAGDDGTAGWQSAPVGSVTIPVPAELIASVQNTVFPTLFTGAITAGRGVPYRVRAGSIFATNADAYDAFVDAISSAVSNNAPSVMTILPGTLNYPLNIGVYEETVLGNQYPGVSVGVGFTYSQLVGSTMYTFNIELTLMAQYMEYSGVATRVYYAPAIATLVDTE